MRYKFALVPGHQWLQRSCGGDAADTDVWSSNGYLGYLGFNEAAAVTPQTQG